MTKTTFILAGGNDRNFEDYAKHLERELTKHTVRPRIVSCFFSSPENEWSAKFRDWEQWFSKNFSIDFEYEYARESTFLKQIDLADVVYVHGGDTQLLFDSLPDTEELKRHFAGKTIVGSSAGANMLSKNYWSSRKAVPKRGLGFVDVNVMVHYGASNHEGRERTLEDWKKEEAVFKEFVGSSDISHIPEGQFIVKRVEAKALDKA